MSRTSWYVDATKGNPSVPHWKRYKRQVQGAVKKALASPAALATWNESQPWLAKAAELGMRVCAEHMFHERGHVMDQAAYAAVRHQRAQLEPVIAESMQAWRVAQLLGDLGVGIEQAARLINVIGVEAAAKAVAFLDIIDVMLLPEETRGAA